MDQRLVELERKARSDPSNRDWTLQLARHQARLGDSWAAFDSYKVAGLSPGHPELAQLGQGLFSEQKPYLEAFPYSQVAHIIDWTSWNWESQVDALDRGDPFRVLALFHATDSLQQDKLAGFPGLIELRKAAALPAELTAISKIQSLVKLTLFSRSLNEHHLQCLRSLEKLEFLNIDGTTIEGQRLHCLSEFKGLKEVRLSPWQLDRVQRDSDIQRALDHLKVTSR
ncbi:MAG: hypothetical protein P1V97_24080 [Planctomycetota bacterium]|nr:hypothetical protein [Planctomycetota bacterium]